MALIAVLLLVPFLGVLLLRRESMFASKARQADTGVDLLRETLQTFAQIHHILDVAGTVADLTILRPTIMLLRLWATRITRRLAHQQTLERSL